MLRSYVQHEPVFDQFVAVFIRNRPLQLLDILVDKLSDLTRFKANHVVMMRTLIQLVNGMPALEIMPGHETDRLKLRQHPIHGGKTDNLATGFQLAINLFGAEVSLLTLLQQVKDFPAGRRRLQTGFFQIPSFQFFSLPNFAEA